MESYTVAEPVNLKLVAARRRWLHLKKMSVRQVSDKAGLDYNTVVRWFNLGRTPAKLYLDRMLEVFGDWPH